MTSEKDDVVAFEAILAAARPALRTVGTRPLVRRMPVGTERLEHRAVCLSWNDAEPSADGPECLLFVDENGCLFTLTFKDLDHRHHTWRAEQKHYSTYADAYSDGWTDVEAFASRLVNEVQRSIGSRSKSIKQNNDRASRLEALTALLSTVPHEKGLPMTPTYRCHELKTWTEPFDAVWAGEKRCEVRVNDRDFRVGDLLRLRCWNLATETYDGRFILCYVTHVVLGGRFGLPAELCVMSLGEPQRGIEVPPPKVAA